MNVLQPEGRGDFFRLFFSLDRYTYYNPKDGEIFLDYFFLLDRYTYYNPKDGEIYQSIEKLDKEGMAIIESVNPQAFTQYQVLLVKT